MKLFPQPGRVAPLLLITWLGLGLGAAGCASEVDLNAVPAAVKNGCEAPTEAELNPEATMLPGRQCLGCHKSGGQASRRVWTVAGTVYDSPNAGCNSHGVEGVKVEIGDAAGMWVLTMYTNRVGNFFSAEPINTSAFTATVSKDGKYKKMGFVPNTGDCGSCHFPNGESGGRIYLD